MMLCLPSITRRLNYGNAVNRQSPLNAGLVGWWLPMPQNKGGARLLDIAGRYHGDLTSGAAWSGMSSPSSNGSINFDGSDDKVIIGNHPAFDLGTGAFTVSAWIRPNSVTGFHNIMRRDVSTGGGAGFWLLRHNGTTLEFYIGLSAITGGTLVANEWQHVAASRQTDGSALLMLNGAQVASGSLTNTITSTWVLQFGVVSDTNNSEALSGQATDWRFQSAALTAGALSKLYTASSGGWQAELNWLPLSVAGLAVAASGGFRSRIAGGFISA